MENNNLSTIQNRIRTLLWGDQVTKEIFIRWSQGFYFSTSEKSALEQSEGGPCAVIAPVQAYILKKLLTDFNDLSFRDTMTLEMQREVLVQALCEILQQCLTQRFHIVSLKPTEESECNSVINGENSENEQKGGESSNELEPDPEFFHNNLVTHTFELISDVRKYYKENINILGKRYGILLFLYSVIATKGPENLQRDSGLEADSEQLIHMQHGYGSQCLINLMITGKAVNHVCDNYQEVAGLRLYGIDKQSQIGYISSMEHLQFITVGFYYKNPVFPIWILGSDTHLTVLFSDNKKLVSPETKSEEARRVFKSFDEGNNFIKSSQLKEVLTQLELVNDQAYVDIMTRKLDQEGLGIILLNPFMEEFFPEPSTLMPQEFTLYHYNGLPQSNGNQQVKYSCGHATLLDFDLLMHAAIDSNPMLNCLQTKWPNIDIHWIDGTPSLN